MSDSAWIRGAFVGAMLLYSAFYTYSAKRKLDDLRSSPDHLPEKATARLSPLVVYGKKMSEAIAIVGMEHNDTRVLKYMLRLRDEVNAILQPHLARQVTDATGSIYPKPPEKSDNDYFRDKVRDGAKALEKVLKSLRFQDLQPGNSWWKSPAPEALTPPVKVPPGHLCRKDLELLQTHIESHQKD